MERSRSTHKGSLRALLSASAAHNSCIGARHALAHRCEARTNLARPLRHQKKSDLLLPMPGICAENMILPSVNSSVTEYWRGSLGVLAGSAGVALTISGLLRKLLRKTEH